MADVIKIRLKGLNCPHCAEKIQHDVEKLPELKEATVNVIKQELRAIKGKGFQESEAFQKITDIVHLYEPDVEVSLDTKQSEGNDFQYELRGKIVRFALGLALFLGGIFTKGNVQGACYIASYAVFGYDVLLTAIRNIGKGQVFDENFLMSISTIGAISLGELPEAVFVMMFYQIGETFQSMAVHRSRKSIASLMDIRPDYANMLDEYGNEKKIDPASCVVGSVILVKPGEKIPLDGVVLKGQSQLDTSALTGESMPMDAGAGDAVLSGSLNLNGLLTIQVTKEFGESTVVKILEMVESASDKKSKTEQFITKFARIYTPVVVVAAALLAVVPPMVLGGGFTEWISRALTFLVISCPCALVLSVPLSYFSGIGEAGRNGILLKGSNFMHALSEVNTVVFDKTGTLTMGVFQVVDVTVSADFTVKQLLHIAAVGEQRSNHPIAKAITRQYEKEYGLVSQEIEGYQELGGFGIEFQFQGRQIHAGNARLMQKQGVFYEKAEEGASVVYVAVDGKFAGSIVVADQPKENAKQAIGKLKAFGVVNTVMLTGDNKAAAERVSHSLGLDHFYAELLPQNKVELLEGMLAKQQKGKILFVGDGINDAPVLARADIGAAMGGIGSDAAIEAADMVIMNDDIGKIADGIAIARKTNRIVNQNIIFALAVKFVVLGLGAAGIATMWMAVFADVGVTFLAILNACRRKI